MSSINPSNQPYSSNTCTHGPAFQSPRHPISIHLQSYLSNQPSFQPASLYPPFELPSHPYILLSDEPLLHPLIHPNNHTAAIYVLIVHPISHPNILSSIHPQSYLFNQSSIQAASIYPSIWLSRQLYIHSSNEPLRHPLIHSKTIQTIQQQSMYSSSSISVSQTSYHPFIHISIYPISHLSNRNQSIHPSNYQVSHIINGHLFIHWSIQPTIQQQSINSSSILLPPKHLIIHSSTKLFIQSFIHPSGINHSIHLNNQPAIHLFIHRKSFRLINNPYMQSAIRLSKLLLPAILSPKNWSV